MLILSLAIACVFALVHLKISALRFLNATPRSRWLSASGGVAVAYVFLHILPELATHRATFAEGLDTDGRTGERIVYMLALIGLIVFYGLERAIKLSRQRRGDEMRGAIAFWLHIGSFALYNVIIGYLLLHREETGVASLLIYGVAMALHFVSNDFGLRSDHKAEYDRIARWVLAGAILFGWALGALVQLPPLWVGLLFAFIAGGVVLNVMKEELPEERQSRFWPFLGAALGYAAILVAA